MPIDFLTIGHMTQDRVTVGFRPGGTVSYAAVTARRLGRQPGIVTRGRIPGLEPRQTQPISAAASGPSYGPLDGIQLHLLPSEINTVFDNIYNGDGQRIQVVESVAEPIVPAELPAEWSQPPLVLLGPVARELPVAWAEAAIGRWRGATAQGWLREWDENGHVRPARWPDLEPFLRRMDFVVLSREDVQGDEGYITEMAGCARRLVVTDGRNGCTLYQDGGVYPVAARPAQEIDPTGAGDVFAASFLIRLAESGDALQAARFANIIASMSVEASGMAGIPWRSQVEDL